MRMKPTPNVSFHMTFSIHFLYSPLMCRGGMGRKSSSNFLSSFLRLPKSEGRGRKEVFASSGRGGRRGRNPKRQPRLLPLLPLLPPPPPFVDASPLSLLKHLGAEN